MSKHSRAPEIIIINKKVYFSNVDCEAIRARIALKLGRLLSFMIRNFCKKSASGEKNSDRGWALLTISQYSLKFFSGTSLPGIL